MTCSKFRYPNRKSAVAARERLDRKKGRLLQVYECRVCKRWHLGNTAETRVENLNRIFDRLPAGDRAQYLRSDA